MSETFLKYNLNQEIVKALNALGYSKPSDVQQKVLPIILAGKDVVVKSQTGSGKTAAAKSNLSAIFY